MRSQNKGVCSKKKSRLHDSHVCFSGDHSSALVAPFRIVERSYVKIVARFPGLAALTLRRASDPSVVHCARSASSTGFPACRRRHGYYSEFSFFAGLRASAQIALIWHDVDLRNGLIRVRRPRVLTKDKERTQTTKERDV